MLARLFLALLMAMLPMPASADPACHVPPAAVAENSRHGHHRPETPPSAAHETLCIGCVAPATLRAPELAPPALLAPAPLRAVEPAGEPRPALRPATPPPRIA